MHKLNIFFLFQEWKVIMLKQPNFASIWKEKCKAQKTQIQLKVTKWDTLVLFRPTKVIFVVTRPNKGYKELLKAYLTTVSWWAALKSWSEYTIHNIHLFIITTTTTTTNKTLFNSCKWLLYCYYNSKCGSKRVLFKDYVTNFAIRNPD